jgi:hypothetical protein
MAGNDLSDQEIGVFDIDNPTVHYCGHGKHSVKTGFLIKEQEYGN